MNIRKINTFLNIFITLMALLVLQYSSRAVAQEEVDEFFEDEFDEPYSDPNYDPRKGIPPPDPNAPPRLNMPGGNNTQPMGNNAAPGNNRNFGGVGSDEIVFRLVEPPKYWKPKKRKFRPPVQGT